MIYEIKNSSIQIRSKSAKLKSGYCVRIRRDANDKGLEFVVGNVLPTKKTEEDIKSSKQFLLLTKFLEWKGEPYQDGLYNLYQKAYGQLENLAGTPPESPANYKILHQILDYFNYDEVVKFVKDVYKLKVPSVIDYKFDEDKQKDEEGTREQTYTVPDYIELAALVIIIKASFMILGHLAYVCEDQYPDMKKFISVLYKFYSRHERTASLPPMIKLTQFTEKLFYNPKYDEKELLSMVIKKGMADIEIIESLVAQVIFHKLAISSIVEDNDEVYIVNIMFKFVSNKLKPNTSKGQGSITEKTQIGHGSGDERGDRESNFENYVMQTDLTQGDICKVNWCTETMDIILPQLHPYQQELIMKGITTSGGKTYTYKEIHDFLSVFGYFVFPDQSIIMLHPIYKGMLDQRLFDYIETKNMINLLALAIPYIWNLGFQKLALLITSIPAQIEEKMITINATSGRNRIPQDLLEELYKVFPLYREGKKDGDKEYAIRKDVEMYCNSFYNDSWKCLLPPDIVADVFGKQVDIIPVPDDLRIIMCKFLLENEKYSYRENKGE